MNKYKSQKLFGPIYKQVSWKNPNFWKFLNATILKTYTFPYIHAILLMFRIVTMTWLLIPINQIQGFLCNWPVLKWPSGGVCGKCFVKSLKYLLTWFTISTWDTFILFTGPCCFRVSRFPFEGGLVASVYKCVKNLLLHLSLQ